MVQPGKYGAMNPKYKSTMGDYVINFLFEAYNLQYDTTCDGQISSSGELVFRAQYLSFMKEKKNWYWEQIHQQ